MEPGLNDGGFLVCKFIFRVSLEDFGRPPIHFLQRLPGQPPFPEQTEGDMDNGDDAAGDDDATVFPEQDASD